MKKQKLKSKSRRLSLGTFSFCAYCFLSFFASIAIASEQGNFAKPSSHNAQQLWQSRISVPQSEKDKKYRSELQRLIAQIRSIKVEPKNQEAKAVPSTSSEPALSFPKGQAIAIEPVPMTEPNETLSATAASQQPTQEKPREAPGGAVSSQTLQMLENISQQSDQLCKAFELAEILFQSSHLKQAAMFYQQALNRKDPNDIMSAEARAWTLFQIGNCLRDEDLPAAKKMYRQLITEYPNCPWTDLARARENLIDWYRSDKPQTLIAECK